MTNIKNKLKRIGFKIGISAMTFFPAKSAAQDFVIDTATKSVSVRTELVSKDASIINTSSQLKDIIFYANSRRDTLTAKDTLANGAKKANKTLYRDIITLYGNRRTKTVTTGNNTQYVLLAAAVKRDKNKYIFNTNELFDKYRKLVISVFTELRDIAEDEINIEVTFCGPFELIVEHHYGDVIASICRNAYTGVVVEKSREKKVLLFKDMATNEYIISNGNRHRRFTDAEALKDEHSQMIMENNMYER